MILTSPKWTSSYHLQGIKVRTQSRMDYLVNVWNPPAERVSPERIALSKSIGPQLGQKQKVALADFKAFPLLFFAL